jgi:cytochrome c2
MYLNRFWLRCSSHSKSAITLVLGFILFLFLGIIIGRYDLGISRAINFAKLHQKKFLIYRIGEEAVVKDTLHKYYRISNSSPEVEVRTIETSRLPLLLMKAPLAGTAAFFDDKGLVGGAVTKVEDSLFVMDKLGNIFVFDFQSNSLRKLDYGIFPNGFREVIKNTVNPSGFAVRALYIAYDSNAGTIYVSLLKYNAVSQHSRFNVSAISIDKNTKKKTSDWRTVFESEDIPDILNRSDLAGGRLIIVGRILYFTIGDFGAKQMLLAQSPASSFGKIYEFDLLTNRARLKSIGHRNPQGLVFTNEGKLLETEHGPDGGDELNLIADGKNYGWPYRTHGTDYGKFDWHIKFREPDTNFEEPLYAWVPSPAISPIIQISGFHDRWNGDLLVGSLKARTLFRLKFVNDRVVFSEPIWIGHRIRDIAQLGDQIILMTDDPALLFISVDEKRVSRNSKAQSVELDPALAKCLNCHHFGETNPSHLAPTLANILNKPIASDDRFQRYSESLKNKGGNWDEESLRKFIRSPNEFSTGSSMPALGLSSQEIDEIISLLKN